MTDWLMVIFSAFKVDTATSTEAFVKGQFFFYQNLTKSDCAFYMPLASTNDLTASSLKANNLYSNPY